ncbi:hypothetical protein FPV67DRAFT_618274 [Lyophyllum atratum]|nr:hypothetical protein FPV67DRAFT_618274 [Lyophyllum atratum]
MSAPLPRYVHAIRSIKQTFPELPDTLGHVILNEGIPVSAPIRASDLSDAESVAAALRAIKARETEPQVTDDVVRFADLRVRAIQMAHANAAFPSTGDLYAASINRRLLEFSGQMEAIFHRVNVMEAKQENDRITRQNSLSSQYTPEKAYNARLKTIKGDGLTLARAIAQTTAIQATLASLNDGLLIGHAPPNFNPHPGKYSNDEINHLILFYNDDFGILLGDGLHVRRDKVRKFLTNV